MKNKEFVEQNSKVALIMPPCFSKSNNLSWHDYPGIVFLRDYLKKKCVSVDNYDFNLIIAEKLLNKDNILNEIDETKAELNSTIMRAFDNVQNLDYYLSAFRYLLWLRNLQNLDLGNLDYIDILTNNLFNDSSFYYFISKYDIFRHKPKLNNDCEIFSGIESQFLDKIMILFKEIVLNLHNDRKYDVYAISVPTLVHFPYALLISKVIKDAGIDARVCIGGPAVILTNDNDLEKLKSEWGVDYYIKESGYNSLSKILSGEYKITDNRIQGKGEFDVNKDVFKFPSNIQLKKNEVTLMLSYGCYWGKCSFCDYVNLHPKFQVKNVDILLDEIENLTKNQGITKFRLNTEALPPLYAKQFSDNIISRGLDIEWYPIFIMVDNSYTNELFTLMKKSGCLFEKITVGIESFCADSLKFLNKPYSTNDIMKFLEESSIADISFSQFNIISNVPGSDKDCLLKGVDTLKKYINSYNSLSYSVLQTTSSSNVLEKYGNNPETNNSDKYIVDYSRRFIPFNHDELYCNNIHISVNNNLPELSPNLINKKYIEIEQFLSIFSYYPNIDRNKFILFCESDSFEIELKMHNEFSILGSHIKSSSCKGDPFLIPKDWVNITSKFIKGYNLIKFMNAGKNYSLQDVLDNVIAVGLNKPSYEKKVKKFIVYLLSIGYFKNISLIRKSVKNVD